MLNGIGGRTIAEARQRLSFTEYQQWRAFRHKRGSLHQGMRIERATAMLAALYANAHSKGGGYTYYDFMPHQDEPEIDLDQAIASW